MSQIALDIERLAELSIFNDAERREIAAGVVEAIAWMLDRLQTGLATGDLNAVAQAAHRGRNDALVVGAAELERTLAALQDAAQSGRLEEAREHAAAAAALWPATRLAVQRIATT